MPPQGAGNAIVGKPLSRAFRKYACVLPEFRASIARRGREADDGVDARECVTVGGWGSRRG